MFLCLNLSFAFVELFYGLWAGYFLDWKTYYLRLSVINVERRIKR